MLAETMYGRRMAILLALLALGGSARGEDLAEAWRIALGGNAQLQAEQTSSFAAGENVGAAKAARLPSIRTFTADIYLADPPRLKTTLPLSSGATGGAGGLPVVLPLLGNQTNLPFSFTSVNIPLVTFGKIQGGIDAARGQLGAQRASEFRTALDLKLTIAEAYIRILRAQRSLQVAQSNVAQLESFSNDVNNRAEQGMATRNDQLAAEVALDNASLREVRAANALENAWATYNRYLCRPLTMTVPLEELAMPVEDDEHDMEPDGEPLPRSSRIRTRARRIDPAEAAMFTDRALQLRPELVGLTSQARSAGGQARSAAAGNKPQFSFSGGLFYAGAQNLMPQANYVGIFAVDWTLFDGGASRRRSNGYRLQEQALIRKREDAAADIALQVQTQWNNRQEARIRVRVARHAITQAEENIRVVRNRYQEQVSNYTEVLDAETRRLESLTNFYDAFYDLALADFRLHRAVGDL